MPHTHDLVVLPVGSAAVLHRAHAGHVQPIAELGPWSRATHRISRSGARVASLLGESLVESELRADALELVHARAAPKRADERGDMAYLGERLFLGGLFEHEGRKAPMLEAPPGAPGYAALPVPEQTEWKWVDVLVPHSERLIAVDDCFWPRWIYDYVFTPAPAVRHVVEFEVQMPNGEAGAAVMCAGWLCIFERATFRGGHSSSIGLYGPDDLSIRREYRAHLDWDGNVTNVRGGLRPVKTIASDGDRLWVASGEYGVGVADLRGARDVPPLRDGVTPRELERRDLPPIQYRPAPEGRVVADVATVPGQPGCFALLADDIGAAPTGFSWFPPFQEDCEPESRAVREHLAARAPRMRGARRRE